MGGGEWVSSLLVHVYSYTTPSFFCWVLEHSVNSCTVNIANSETVDDLKKLIKKASCIKIVESLPASPLKATYPHCCKALHW